MYFHFTNNVQTMSTRDLSSLGSPAAMFAQQPHTLCKSLLGEEKPSNVLILLAVLVFSLHLLAVTLLLRPSDTSIIPAKPLIMEISMLTMSAPKPSIAPTPAPPKLQQPPKPQVKPIPRKITPVVQKPQEIAPSPQAVTQPTISETAPSQPASASASSSATPKTAEAETFTEANFRANYASNPKPDYPSIARSREWEGKVTLRVQVSAEGLSDAVKIEKSSGHDILDESAMEAVKKWRFIPARRGDTAVASSVLVPINFSLND